MKFAERYIGCGWARRTKNAAALLIVFAAASFPQTVAAQNVHESPSAFVNDLGQRTIGYLSEKDTPRETQENRVRSLLREGFAVQRIGRFVLGKYRRTAEAETVNEFVGVFEDYIVNFYTTQFSRYSGETLEVRKVIQKSRARDSMVMTQFTPTNGRPPLRIDFQVRDIGGSFKIMDVRIEGVSMVLAQRDEFTTFIGNNGGTVTKLIDALRSKMVKVSRTSEIR